MSAAGWATISASPPSSPHRSLDQLPQRPILPLPPRCHHPHTHTHRYALPRDCLLAHDSRPNSEYINPAPHPAESAIGNIPPCACLARSSHEWRERRPQSEAHLCPLSPVLLHTHPRERDSQTSSIAMPLPPAHTLPCMWSARVA
jgi:hypothetical protein